MRLSGRLIRLLRVSKGLQQREFAQRLAISQSKLSFIENGLKSVSPEMDARIREVFRVDDVTVAALALGDYLGRGEKRDDGKPTGK